MRRPSPPRTAPRSSGPSRRMASGRAGRPASNTTVEPPAGARRSPNPDPGRAPRPSAFWAASLIRSIHVRIALAPPAPGGGASRRAIQRFASRATAASTNAPGEQPEGGRQTGPEDRIEPDARIPERIRPEIEADAEEEEQTQDDDHRRPQAKAPPRICRAATQTAAVIWATRPATSWRAAAPSRSVDRTRPLPGPLERTWLVVCVVRLAASPVGRLVGVRRIVRIIRRVTLIGVVGIARCAPAWWARILAPSGGFPAPKLVEEVVKEVAHVQRVYAPHGLRVGEGPRPRGETR